jgi:hypothetical protein
MRTRQAYAYTVEIHFYAVQLSMLGLSRTTKEDVESYLLLDKRSLSPLCHATASTA